jgi:hypothetical protein
VQELDADSKEGSNRAIIIQAINKFFKEKSSALIPVTCILAGLYVSCLYTKGNSLAVISTLCTIMGLYLSYRNNCESLRLSQASFIIDKGATAFKNLSLIGEEQYDQFASLGKHSNKV